MNQGELSRRQVLHLIDYREAVTGGGKHAPLVSEQVGIEELRLYEPAPILLEQTVKPVSLALGKDRLARPQRTYASRLKIPSACAALTL